MDKIKIYKEEILKWLANDFIESLKNGKNEICYRGKEIEDKILYDVYQFMDVKHLNNMKIRYFVDVHVNCQDNSKGYVDLASGANSLLLSTEDNSISDGVISDLLFKIIECASNEYYEDNLTKLLLTIGYDSEQIKNLTKIEV